VASFRALRFVKPEILDGIGSASTNEPMIGNIEVEIYEEFCAYVDIRRRQDKLGTMEATTVSSRGGGMSKAKFVRSAAGKTTHLMKKRSTGTTRIERVQGAKLQTIMLHYCTVPGLMHVGVLPKPENTLEAYKMMNPHKKRPRHCLVELVRQAAIYLLLPFVAYFRFNVIIDCWNASGATSLVAAMTVVLPD
jgi:hypothetical protein